MKRAPALLALLLSGCFPPPPRTDPFAALGGSPASSAATKSLDLGVVLSDNTKAAATYLESVNRKLGMNPSARFDSGKVFSDTIDALRAAFKSATRLESVEEAKGKVDLVAILDIYVKPGAASFTRSRADVAAQFLTPDKQVVDTVKGHGEHRVPYPAFSLKVAEAMADAVRAFSGSLATSTALADYALKHPSAKAAAAPVASAPASQAPAPARRFDSDVEQPTYSFPEDPRRFALVVGIEKYASLPPADFAERDAAAVRAHLRALGYPERNIIYLAGQQAGKSSLEKYLEAWLPKNVKPDSRVTFFFSGHGAPDTESGQAYLVPWDGDAKFLANTGYPVKRLYERLNALPAKEIVVAMDACFSGAGGRSVIARGTRPLVAKVDEGASATGRAAVLAAAGPDEITGSSESSGHGLFTYHLLKGLNARKGTATLKDLHEYLLPQVQDEARRENRDQTPRLIAPEGQARLSVR